MEGTYKDEAEDIDDALDEDESTTIVRGRAPRDPQVKFPTEDEFQGGYIWGQDLYFEASIENIRSVQNVDTNHRILSQRRVIEMYRQLEGHEASLVTPLTLQSIAYIIEDIGPDNERRQREVFFGAHCEQMEFEAAYLQNASAVSSRTEDNQRQWLENNIIWEPVDGQHIVVACRLAKVQEHEEEFKTCFARCMAKFHRVQQLKLIH